MYPSDLPMFDQDFRSAANRDLGHAPPPSYDKPPGPIGNAILTAGVIVGLAPIILPALVLFGIPSLIGQKRE